MLLYLHDGYYMFLQGNAILREQTRFFLSYFNINMVRSNSWNKWYRPMCQRVLQQTVMEPTKSIQQAGFLQKPSSLYAQYKNQNQFT
jgi:hypothetical protein